MPLTAEVNHETCLRRSGGDRHNRIDRHDRLLPSRSRSAKAYQRAPQAASPGVYAGPRRGNTDPDPNVQFEIMRQQNWRKGG